MTRRAAVVVFGFILLVACTPKNPPMSGTEIKTLIGDKGITAGHMIRDEIIDIKPDGEITRVVGGSSGPWRPVPSYRWTLQGDRFCVDKGQGSQCFTLYKEQAYGYDQLRWVREDGSTDGIWIIIK